MEIILKNLMEDYVAAKIEELLPKVECCSCEHCKLDIISYSLNRLPSKYVATTKGELMAKLCEFDPQFEATTTSVVLQAIEVVRAHPRHAIEVPCPDEKI